MKLLYFAWLKNKIGTASEEITLPAEVVDVTGLLDWLHARGPDYAEALGDRRRIRVAVNQEYARSDTPVSGTDEVALFPPVTGG
ncbi:molybdopterin converting factor subunit 1 [Fodinicurvata halophila]|uniref:Molybdopterin synthase sulfur carrier subunit n=1 Tax=Fodinicurvata halophila TaxID=1419723 RepID=A0ABV8UNA0_9PROT